MRAIYRVFRQARRHGLNMAKGDETMFDKRVGAMNQYIRDVRSELNKLNRHGRQVL